MNIEPFETWERRFRSSSLGKKALLLLEERFPGDKEPPQIQCLGPLSGVVLLSCYGAAMFDPSDDPTKIARLSNSTLSAQLAEQRQAVQLLRNFLAQHASAADVALGRGSQDLKRSGIRFGTANGTPRRMSEVLDRILEVYARGLRLPLPGARSGPLLKRYVYGCFIYDTPLDDGWHNKPPEPDTMLYFDLVQLFRLRLQKIWLRQLGEPMPNCRHHVGRLAVAFVRATFSDRNSSMSAARAKAVPTPRTLSGRLKKLLQANPGLGYYGWPAVRDQ